MGRARTALTAGAAVILLGARARAETPDEVRALVAEMLADAETRSSLRGPWLGEEPHRLRIHGYIQFRYVWNHREAPPEGGQEDTHGFQTARTRMFVDGDVAEGLSFRIRWTFNRNGGGASLDQAYTNIAIGDGYSLRVGQFGLPLFRDEYINAEKQLAVNSSPTNSLFNQGQAQGVQLSRSFDDWRFWAAFTDGLRSGNRDLEDPREADYAGTVRAEWKLAGDDWSRFDDYTSFQGSDFAAMLGGAVHYEAGAETAAGNEEFDLFYVTADLGIEGDGWSLFAGGVMAYNNANREGHDTDAGFLVQGGVFVDERVELFGRFDMTIPSGEREENGGSLRSLTGGFNYYHFPESHALKFTANLIWFLDPQGESLNGRDTLVGLLEDGADNQWAVQAQVQLMF